MKRLLIFALTIVLSLLLAACGGAPAPSEPAAEEVEEPAAEEAEAPAAEEEAAAEAPAGEPIKIGGTLGLTGAFAGPSADYKLAYDLWVEQVNAKGGLLGRPVEMIIYDDESTPATAQALYQRLINEDGVDLILAPYTTFIGGGIIPIAESNKKLMFNGGFVGIELFENTDWMVGGYTYQEPDYPRAVFEMIDALPEEKRPKRVGIVTAQNPFTLVVRDGFNGEGGVIPRAEERGLEIVLNEEYPGNINDVSGLIQQAKAADVDLFFALTLPNDGALMARTAHELDFKPAIYCSCGSQVTTIPFWRDLGEAGEEIMATAMAWPSDNYPGLDDLFERLQSERGYKDMPAYGGVAYGILQVMEQAVEGVGSLDQEALRDYVTDRTFETANGPMAYDDHRIPAYNAILTQFVDGENRIIWPPERATGDPIIGGEEISVGRESAEAEPAAPAEPAGEPIKIGGTLGLTGAFAGPSADYKIAYDLWVEQTNAKGGLLGRPVEMIIYDDESTPATAQALYQRLINEDGVDLILAPYTTFIGGGIIPVAEANKKLLWNGGFVGIELFQNTDWLVGGYTYQEPEYPRGIFAIIDSLPEEQRPTRVGIATAQNPFTLIVRDGFEGEGGVIPEAEKRGMEIVLNEEYPGNANDLSGIVQQAKAADVELFFALTLPNDGFLMARTANELGFKPTIYCSCGSQVTTLPAWPDLGEAGEGIMATAMVSPKDNYEGLTELFDRLKEEKGYNEMPAYGGVAYGILQVLEQAVQETGTLDQEALRDFVTNRTFETANGPMAYDEHRIPAFNAVVVQFIDGQNQVVWPPERATGEPAVPMP